jgi:hypothetical protein
VQFDEKWSFVGKKQDHCDPGDPLDLLKGDDWSHIAIDPEHRLLISLVPGKRTGENCEKLVEDTKRRTGGRTDLLITSDEHSPYTPAIEKAYAREVPRPKKPGPGRRPKPDRVMPEDLCYATVCKTRKHGRVVEVVRAVVFGTAARLAAMLKRSTVSKTVNTAFVERANGTERGMNARTTRKTYCFSKQWEFHNAAAYLIGFSYNFCWPVRTLRVPTTSGQRMSGSPIPHGRLSEVQTPPDAACDLLAAGQAPSLPHDLLRP